MNKNNWFLKKWKNVILLTHYNPDGDAIGSVLSFNLYLNKKGIKSTIIIPNNYPNYLKFLPNSNKILISENNEEKSKHKIKSADLILCLDFNNPSRINHLKYFLSISKAKKIIIDHHERSKNNFFDISYINTLSTSTCEIIYEIIYENKDLNLIDKKIASCIYTGIYTDSGGFKFHNTSSRTHEIISNLLKHKIYPTKIIDNILNNKSLDEYKCLAKVLLNLRILNSNTAILYLTKKDMKGHILNQGDTSNFVNYGLNLLGVNLSIFLLEDCKKKIIKISFRSKNNFNVNRFAKKYFNGGGHKKAAGGVSLESINTTINKIEELLKIEKDEF